MKPVWNFTYFGHLKLFRISVSCFEFFVLGAFAVFAVKNEWQLSFQEAQIQGAINTDFLLLHAVAGKPLGLIRQVFHEGVGPSDLDRAESLPG